MSAQPTLTWEQYQQLPPEKRSRPLTPAEYAALTRQQRIAAGLDDDEGGAPPDFSGPVFPNPDHVVVSDDTDSGIPALRLPNGVRAVTGAYRGAPKMDTSNPSPAQVLPAQIQTVGAKTTGVDYDALAQQHGATVDYDQLASQHGAVGAPQNEQAQPAEQPGWLDREIPLTSHWNATLQGLQNIARGGKQALVGAYDAGKLPTNKEEWAIFLAGGPPALMSYRTGKGLVDTGKQAAEVPAAIHDINQSADPLGTYGQVAGRTAGEGAGQAIVALATEKAGEVSPTKATAPVRAVIRGANKALEKAPGTIGASVGAAAGHATGIPGAAEVGAGAGYALGKEVLPQIKIPGENVGLPKTVAGGPKVAPQYVEPIQNAAAARAAGAEDLEGVTSPQTEAAGEVPIEQVPAEMQAPVQNAAAARANPPDTSPKAVQGQLEQSLGAAPVRKPVPGVAMRNQAAAQSAAAGVPFEHGKVSFTPVKSSAFQGYSYNPATQELDIMQSGSHYRYVGVEPETFGRLESEAGKAAAGEKGASAGKALNDLRQAPGVQRSGKVGANGTFTPTVKPKFMRSVVFDPETGQPEFSDALEAKRKNLQDFITPQKTAAAKTAAPVETPAPAEQDLTSLLQESVEQAKAAKTSNLQQAIAQAKTGKGGMTTVDPAELSERWGVNESSLKRGREQTRGWSPKESEAEIKKLETRYRNGQAVDPVMETVDENGNTLDVDGRGRVIAAKRAGIKKIPFIVRRLRTQ